ncbi:hypothetical protein CcrC1_gp433 [Caulobacter phage C1]|nr:hypothetical protein CcrC1_gp433 [Caulobacter phage C1]UTU08662.1 hypothetical protein CcrC2_gp434 [Caulobacter phage C2]UTU09175.1 hypothetical protein CcrJ4_gp428 [Caulobacter phage J4]UTU09740.1 hypothetical protein CcrBL47_gp456 [Caulobacter phage BL47]UTU10294.1 hypothetical protein CcrRB23_gp432 [Caulobacter phage RB23]WGN97328.1 hypothetical protein [Bertelyvirus sp.]
MIDPREVKALYFDVVATDGDFIEGITGAFCLNLEALARHREAVRDWVDQIADEFQRGKGEGMSFLRLCIDADGVQWTGEQQVCELLYVLAAGLNMARFCMPRDIWPHMPGGVPYVVFDREGSLTPIAT